MFYVLIVSLTLLWGLTFPTMKIGLNEMSTFMFLLLRSAASSVVLFGLIWARRGKVLPPRGRPEFWWNTLLHNLMFILCYHGAAITTSGRTSVFLYTQPLFYTALAAWLIPAERLGLRAILGFVAAFGGIVVLFGERLGTGGIDTTAGDLLVIGAALVWGIQSLYLREKLKGIDSFRIAAWTQLIAIPIFGVFALLRGGTIPDFSRWGVLVSVGYNGVVGTGLAMVLWVYLLAGYPPSRVSAFMFLTPVFGLLMSGWILSEPLTGWMWAGGALVAAGIYLVNTDRRRLAGLGQRGGPTGAGNR